MCNVQVGGGQRCPVPGEKRGSSVLLIQAAQQERDCGIADNLSWPIGPAHSEATRETIRHPKRKIRTMPNMRDSQESGTHSRHYRRLVTQINITIKKNIKNTKKISFQMPQPPVRAICHEQLRKTAREQQRYTLAKGVCNEEWVRGVTDLLFQLV